MNWLLFLLKKKFVLRIKISSKCSPQDTKSNQIENSDQMHPPFPRLHAPLPIAFVSPDSDMPPDCFTRRMSGHSLGRFRAVNFSPLPKCNKCRLPTTDIRNAPCDSSCEIRSERSGTETSYSPSSLVFPANITSLMFTASITSLMFYAHLHLHTAHVRPKDWRSLGTFK